MISLDRRKLFKNFVLLALSSFLSSASRASGVGATIFMADAINDIRKQIGVPVDGRFLPPWDPQHGPFSGLENSGDLPNPTPPPDLDFKFDKFRDVPKASSTDLRLPPRRPRRLERWGGVCVPIPFADFDYYYTDAEIDWWPNPGQHFPKVSVPRGFCTDLASIPQFFWSFGLPRTGRYAYAAIVHDFLYWDQTIATREQANEILYTAMVNSHVATITREAINFAVAKIPFFSQNAWDQNAAAKKAGEKRFLAIFPPTDKIVSWADWSKDPSHLKG